MSRLFTYTIPIDDGAAPNPFHDLCTLAICKPAIRRVAQPGDWVAGLGAKKAPSGDLSGKLVYAMFVHEVVALRDYDRRAATDWPHRVPVFTTGDRKDRLGDCIYDFSAGVPPYQRKSVHGPGNVDTDLGGQNALIAREYYYFGRDAVPLPTELLPIIHQVQGHKSTANDSYVATFEFWIRQFRIGVHGAPDMTVDWTSTYCEPRALDGAKDREC